MAKNRLSNRVPFYVAGAFAVALAALHPSGAFRFLDNKWADTMFRWRGMRPADPRISIVAIDDESIRQVGQYPWPRGVYSNLLDRLFAAGVRVVGLDIIFPDPSYPDEDRKLVQATAKWGERVVLSINFNLKAARRYSFRFPFPALKAAAKAVGVVNQMEVDPDGLIRRTDLMYGTSLDPRRWYMDEGRQPSLGLSVLAAYEGRPPDEYVGRRNLLELNVRGQERGYETAYGIRRISAGKVLNGKLGLDEKKALSGGIVLVGSTAIAAYDHYPTPFTDQAPGVEVHATVIDNILQRRELRRVQGWITVLVAVALAFFSAWALILSPLAGTLLVLVALAAWIALNLYAFQRYFLLQFTAPTLAIAGPFLVLLVRRTLLEHQEKRFIKQTFGQFVAPEVVDDLIKDPGKVRLGGEKREMTVLFLDIAHFTAISEKMDPEALIQFLNRYLSALSGVVHKRLGVVDKYIGDCIMAFWNAPLEQKDHRALACLAAVECQAMMEDVNRRLDRQVPQRPAIRIGVNSGVMTVGLTGSEQKLQYTVIGDEVNLASRLEGANKFFGSRIMASEACYDGAREQVEARALGRIRVVGKSAPVRVFELLGRKGGLSPEWRRALPHYEEGLSAFEAGKYAQAKAQFSKALEIIPEDGPSKLYRGMAEDYEAVAPPAGWDGVFNLTAK